MEQILDHLQAMQERLEAWMDFNQEEFKAM
jgi:hypothetical protein